MSPERSWTSGLGPCSRSQCWRGSLFGASPISPRPVLSNCILPALLNARTFPPSFLFQDHGENRYTEENAGPRVWEERKRKKMEESRSLPKRAWVEKDGKGEGKGRKNMSS